MKLYDTSAPGAGTQQGATIQLDKITVTNGDFTLLLDFGTGVFTGAELYLETGWRVAGGGLFTVLSAREKVTAVYANRSLSAATADTAAQLGGLPPSAFIQNTTSQQSGGFNVAGNGSVGGALSGGTVNAATQFNLAGTRILSNSGNQNLFAGDGAGISNTTGYLNAFFGHDAGPLNTDGDHNSFFGARAGHNNTTGVQNSFFGSSAGASNTTGWRNIFVGSDAGGSNLTGAGNVFVGNGAGYYNTVGRFNCFLGDYAAPYNTTGVLNSFFGAGAGNGNQTGSNNSAFGSGADLPDGLTNATAIGYRAFVAQNNSLVLGSINGVNNATADTRVGIGTTTPAFKLQVSDPSNSGLRVETGSTGGRVASFGGNGDFQIDAPFFVGGRLTVKENGFVGLGNPSPQDRLDVAGFIRISKLGSAGSQTLCRNGSNQVSTCSSSLRYKTNLAPFRGGLSLVNRLQPITFNWKSNGEADLGLGAEDVAGVEPLLVTHNEKGEVEGVKYDRVAVILLNAVKEQQQQIESLKRIVCLDHPSAQVCQGISNPSTGSEVKR